ASGSCGVRLDWVTASEAQSDQFELERSADGHSFIKVATVASHNSAGGGTYTYADPQPGEGRHYYRLKLIDRDHTSTYSPVATLTVACGAAGLVQLVPNPATSTVQLLGLRAGQTIRIYSSDSRLVYSLVATEASQLLDVSNWATGLYLLHVRSADGQVVGTHKLLKQ
ncbi:MAG: T9SS type A sorting domain-containing protein, partial [Hymenobacter sp.]